MHFKGIIQFGKVPLKNNGGQTSFLAINTNNFGGNKNGPEFKISFLISIFFAFI